MAGGMCGRRHVWQGWGGELSGRGTCMAGGVCGKGACMAGGMCGGGMHGGGGGACVAGEMATAVDGTHPTGMHSCDVTVCGG